MGEDIIKYLKIHDGFQVHPLFEGYEQFEFLKSQNLLVPRITTIRLMWNIGRGDEHFDITEDFKLEGILLNAHSGRPGIHDPKEILQIKDNFRSGNKYVPFEISMPNREVLYPKFYA